MQTCILACIFMARNFSTTIRYNKQHLLTVVVPSLRRNGMHYEVNIPGFPRFWLRWGALGRYELVKPLDITLPDELILAVSDAIEKIEQ